MTQATGVPTPARDRLLVPLENLRRRLDPAQLPFESTADVRPLEGTMGQPRALEAIEFGLQSSGFGYNLFVSGAPGSGRASTVLRFLERYAKTLPRPDDWIYVHNFENLDRPAAIRLPGGLGRAFADDMARFVDRARQEVSQAFENERFDEQRRARMARTEKERDSLIEALQAYGLERGFAVQPTPSGFVSMPVRQGHPMTPEEVQHLSEGDRHDLQRRAEEVEAKVESEIRLLQQVAREAAEDLAKLEREVAMFAVEPLFSELRAKYAAVPEVVGHLEAIRGDIPHHIADFRGEPEHAPQLPATLREMGLRDDHTDRYRVNLLVDRDGIEGAPIVIERNPTYYNLVGRVEYRASFGAMFTDFRQIKAGAIHRANGGFLVLEAMDVLANPFAWEALKRALTARELRIENLGEQLTPVPTASLAPQPVPVSLKVVLVGTPQLYQLLFALDPDFRQLFKVKADFAPEMDRTEDHVGEYAAFISRVVRDNGLRHFDRSAVAAIVEHGSWLSDHQGRLSTRLLDISDVVTESSFWAARAGHELVTAEDVGRAVTAKKRRSDLVEERIGQMIQEGTLMIDVEGERSGQVNGLSILDLGDYAFGIPSRITASVALGRGTVDSIERQIELSGPIHSKGVLILSGYLAARYARDWPLALRATLTFEQSYEEVEGDSASSAELYALLSAISDLPLAQGIAVTGSVNQHGEIQAVGGVTQKVEGFFRVCQASGLNGEQGVILPAANVRHLMLSEEVLSAVAGGRFRIWAATSVDDGLEILSGRPAGRLGEDGTYPEGSVHQLVASRLRGFAERQRQFATGPDGTAEVAQPARAAPAVPVPSRNQRRRR